MFDEDQDESRPSGLPPEPRPLDVSAAVLWFLFATALWILISLVTVAFRESAASDLINRVTCQAAAYAVTFYAIVRIHGAPKGLTDVLGLRLTHLSFYPLAAALGVSLQVPAEIIRRVIERRWPTPAEDIAAQLEVLRVDTNARRIIVAVVAVALGPLIEEFFFRGALFRGLRRLYSPFFVVPLVAALFSAAHLGPRVFLPILVPGLAFGLLRAATGSLIPALIAHMSFNAVAVFGLLSGSMDLDQDLSPLPPAIAFGGTGLSVLLVAIVIAISKHSEQAEQARKEDLT